MPSEHNESDFLERVQNIIHQNLSNPHFGVAELASDTPMHRSSLARKLREMTGRSPSELIEEMRMEKAHQLITTTDMLVAQVASEVGFTELSNFSRAFKRYYGDSPSNVRNSDF